MADDKYIIGMSVFFFVDHLQLAYSHQSIAEINTKLQDTIEHINSWTIENGFNF